MKPSMLSKFTRGILLAIWLTGSLLPFHTDVSAASSVNINVSQMIPFARFLGALIARNKTYASVDEYTSERNDYYDSLRDTLRAQFKDYVQGLVTNQPNTPKINPMRNNQVAAYVMDAALIEAQRSSTITFAESLKKSAKKTFDQALEQQVQDTLMGTGMLKEVFSAITSGLGAAQTLVNLLSGNLDKLSGVGQQLQQLRSISDQLSVASAVFGGSTIQGLQGALNNLSQKIQNNDLSNGDLDEAKQQIGDLLTRLQGMQKNDRMPEASDEVVKDLGMHLVGYDTGSPATQAILNLLAQRSGLSYDQVRTMGMALLAAGDKARCQKEVAAIRAAMKELAAEEGVDVKIIPPEALCNEITAEKLFAKAAATTKANTQAGNGGAANPQPSGTVHPTTAPEVLFLDSDCPTAGFSGLTANGSHAALDCMYHWVGKSGPNNLELRITQYNDPKIYNRILSTDITKNFPNEMASDKQEYSSTAVGSQYSNYSLVMMEQDNNGYIFLNTYQDSQTIAKPEVPLCGRGHGEFGVEGKFVVELQVRSCDLENFNNSYQGVMNALKDAAQAAITRADANTAP